MFNSWIGISTKGTPVILCPDVIVQLFKSKLYCVFMCILICNISSEKWIRRENQ